MSIAGINGNEFIVLAILAAVLLGPEKLPDYARKTATLIRQLRRLASDAEQQLREDLGDEFEDLDLKRLDPRQYDPRRIISDALRENLDELTGLALSDSATARKPAPPRSPPPPSGTAPFDDEST
ncbi:Sec-independent protein translocase TatB [Glutamicibacter nicotianae]|uniref:Sec-independent protein translocase TatB n=1 Tax=Glutamicibacter nicotianae TaxID=37929 RepID=UPI003C30374E